MKPLHYGFTIREVQPNVMPQAHYHHDIELVYMKSGTITYGYNARSISLEPGDLMLFWAAIPHRLEQIVDLGITYIITVPLEFFLGWGLDTSFVTSIMNGVPLIQSNPLKQFNLVDGYFLHWQRDLKFGAPEWREIVLLELQALLKRLSLESGVRLKLADNDEYAVPPIRAVHANAMARFIAGHYTEPLTLRTIADVVNINPSYASTLFAEEFQVTIWDYLTQFRIAHAQRLLVLTNHRIEEIAYESGFTSISQFYSVFKKLCKQSPKRFRKTQRMMKV